MVGVSRGGGIIHSVYRREEEEEEEEGFTMLRNRKRVGYLLSFPSCKFFRIRENTALLRRGLPLELCFGRRGDKEREVGHDGRTTRRVRTIR